MFLKTTNIPKAFPIERTLVGGKAFGQTKICFWHSEHFFCPKGFSENTIMGYFAREKTKLFNSCKFNAIPVQCVWKPIEAISGHIGLASGPQRSPSLPPAHFGSSRTATLRRFLLLSLNSYIFWFFINYWNHSRFLPLYMQNCGLWVDISGLYR